MFDSIDHPCNAITLNGFLRAYFNQWMIGFEPADNYDGDNSIPHTYKIIKHDPLQPCPQEFPCD